jgi:DNA-binding GntR family transcriptional regulator
MPDSLWRQIAEDLRARIEAGEIAEGERLPTELDLQQTYHVSRNTVRDALKWLVARGLIMTRSGQGTFVTPRIQPVVTTLGRGIEGAADGLGAEVLIRSPTATPPRVEIVRPGRSVTGELGLDDDQTVVARSQSRFIDGQPYSIQTSYFPMGLVNRGASRLLQAEEIVGGAVGYLADLLGVREVGARDRIAVRMPDSSEAAFFALPDDGRVAVIELRRVGYDEDGQPIRLTVTTCPADRNQFVLTSDVPAVPASGPQPESMPDSLLARSGRGDEELRRAGPADEQVGPAEPTGPAARSLAEAVAGLDPEIRYFLARAGRDQRPESWLFEGRGLERGEIMTWLSDSRSGLFVVTGAPGAGKSALLADVLARSPRELRGPLLRDGLYDFGVAYRFYVFDAVLHLGGLTVPEVARRLAAALAAALARRVAGRSEPDTTDLEDLTRQLANTTGQVTILADGLDQAADPAGTARSVLARLAAITGVRVLVGTRASDAATEGPDLLLGALSALHVLTLTPVPDAVRRYAAAYLRQVAATKVQSGAELDRVAAAIAQRQPEFLLARLALYEVAEDPRLLAPELAGALGTLLDGGYPSLFAAAADRLAASDARHTVLLRALAQARGRGMSESDWIWAAVAAAPSQPPGESGPSEPGWPQLVRTLLEHAAPYIVVDDRPGEQIRCRLAHSAFAEFLTARDTERDQTHLPAFDRAAEADLDGYLSEFAAGSPALEAALRTGRLPCSPDLGARSPELARLAMRLWRLTSVHSPVHHQLLDAGARGDQAQDDSAADEPDQPAGDLAVRPAPAGPPRTSAQAAGARLETSVLDLLDILFRVDGDDSRRLRTQVRRQQAGTQYGADLVVRRPTDRLLRRGIQFRAIARKGASTCLVECKNYTSAVTTGTVSDKLLQAEMEFEAETVDHWILISPHQDPSNELDRAIQRWNSRHRFPFTIQVWSPQSRVKDLFALVPDIYRDLYGEDPPQPPPDPELVVNEFAERLQPRVRLPERLARYIQDPASFVRRHEMAWLEQIDSELVRFGYDEKGIRLRRPLQAEILAAICDPPSGSKVALLLAEFGEGKSFFTVSLCRRLQDQYLAEPGSGSPIPVRLLLQGFRHVTSATEFLSQQLGFIGLSIPDWSELLRDAEVLVILDGLDEMSVRQDPATTQANLEKIGSLLDLLEGVPVLITSRPHFLSSATDRERFYDRLRRPQVFRMGQPERWDVVAHLRAFATTAALAGKLDVIKSLHDPVALASKMLFLEMTKDALPDLPAERLDELTLYRVYVTRALKRKIELLRDPQHAVLDQDLMEQLQHLLEKIAVAIHVSGEGCVDLRDFVADAGGAARLLWQSAQADEMPAGSQEDAAVRIGGRSLLRRVATGVDDDAEDGWLVDFFHRSMKEYFVARALLRAVQSPGAFEATGELLARAPVQPEILGFFRLLAAGGAGATGVLARIARSAAVGPGSELIGGGAISLFAAIGGQLSGAGWRSLNLDGALLPGADLTGADLRGSTLRGGDLSSADLTGADLRGCDLSDASLTAGGAIVALSPQAPGRQFAGLTTESELGRITVAADGALTYSAIRGPSSVESPTGLCTLGEDLLLVSGGSELLIVHVGGAAAEEVSRFRISGAVRAVDIVERSALGLLVETGPGRAAALLADIGSGRLTWRIPVPPGGQACAWSATGVAIAYRTGIRVYRADGGSGPAEADLTCSGRGLSMQAGTAVAVTAEGRVAWLPPGGAQPVVSVAVHHGAGTAVAASGDSILSAGADGSIAITRRNGAGPPVVVARLERRLRCEGARVRGLRREQERLAFVANGADAD